MLLIMTLSRRLLKNISQGNYYEKINSKVVTELIFHVHLK